MTKFYLSLFLAAWMSSIAIAQDVVTPDIPARITETVYMEAPDDHVLGRDDAVQTLIVYASVTCPHCRDWFSEEWPKVKTELVEGGTLRFVFREYPTAPAELALTGFMLAECAPVEDYFDVIEYQMENQDEIFEAAKAGKAREAYDEIAKRAGMDDVDAIGACLGNPDMYAHIQDNNQRAALGKIRGVPAFFINGEPYGGPQDADSLIELITDMDAKGLTALPEDLVQSSTVDHSGHNHD